MNLNRHLNIVRFSLLSSVAFCPLLQAEEDPMNLSVQDKISFYENRIHKANEKLGGPLTEDQKAHQQAILDKLKEVIIKADQFDGLSLEERLKLINAHNPAIAFRDEQGRIFDKKGEEIKHGHPDYLDIHAVSPRLLKQKRKELVETGILTLEERASLTSDLPE